MTKVKIAATAALAAAALVSVGVVAVGSWRPDPPRAAPIPQAGGEMKRPAATQGAPAAGPVEMIEVRGRVVDPAGRPVAGASVRGAYLDAEIEPAPSDDQRAGRPVRTAGTALAAQHRDAAGGRHVPLGGRVGTGVWARLGLGRAIAGGPRRDDAPPGGGRSADRGSDRRPRGPARRRRPGQGGEHLDRPQGEPVGLARTDPERRGPGALAGPGPVADGRRGHDRTRRPLPPDGDRPRPARRAARLGADDRHGPALRRQP